MARYAAWALTALLILPVYSRAGEVCIHNQPPQQRGAQGAQGAQNDARAQGHQPRPKWWIDPHLRQQLSITDAQSKAVDEIWQKSALRLHELRMQLDKL